MKKSFVIIAALFISITSYSQSKDFVEYRQNWDKQRVFWGYYIGLNKHNFNIRYAENRKIDIETNVGFHLGLIGNLRLHNNIDLRLEPGLISNTRRLNYTYINKKSDSIRKINSTYLRIPLLLKLNTNRYYNIRPYLTGGVSYDYNFSSRKNSSRDNSEGIFRMKRHNFTYEVGVGVDIYFPRFIFSPSIRGIFAINNEIIRDKAEQKGGYSKWTSPIENISSRGVFVRFAFH